MRHASNILTILCLGGLALTALQGRPGAPRNPAAAPGAPAALVVGPVEAGPVAAAPAPDDADAGTVALGDSAPEAEDPVAAPAPAVTPIIAGMLAPKPVLRPDHVATPSICGDPRLAGVPLDALAEDDDDRCGADEPVRLTAAAGVEISPEVVTSCALAVALADWLENDVADHAQTVMKQPIVGVDQVSGYVCRNRNNAAEGRLSEHALARAIDIARFRFADGATVTVEDGWPGKAAPARFLRAVWTSACGRFGTVLGPESDDWHRDHFHLDAAERRTAYCR